MDILVAFLGSGMILFMGGCLKLIFKLLDVKSELKEVRATCDSILKNIIDWRIEGL